MKTFVSFVFVLVPLALAQPTVGRYVGSRPGTGVSMTVLVKADNTASIDLKVFGQSMLVCTDVPFTAETESALRYDGERVQLDYERLHEAVERMMSVPGVQLFSGRVSAGGIEAFFYPEGRKGEGAAQVLLQVTNANAKLVLSLAADHDGEDF